MSKSLRLFALAVAMFAGPGVAKELEVQGRASVPIPPPPKEGKEKLPPPDLQAIRATAARAARRQAAIAAIEKVLGPGASKDPRVASQVDAVVVQLGDERVVDTRASRVGDDYEVTVKLVLDDKEFRTLLSDLGIAINTAAVRSFSILSVMDEFFTSPRDLKAPLEELEEFSRLQGATYDDRSRGSESFNASSSDHAQASLSVEGRRGSATAQAKASSKSSAKGEAAFANDVSAEAHDDVRYKKLIRYQPQNVGPEKTSQAYNALMGQLQDYDLRVLDNDVFRSRHFKDAPLTIEQMQNGEALSRYVAFARTEANADFFLVGNSIVIDSGKNRSTGDQQCSGLMTVKTYSTVDGESIASETISEAATGLDVNDCAANVAKKLARIGGPILGARVQEYWKRRSTYGREFVVTLRGLTLPLMLKTQFSKALKSLPGIESDAQRMSNGKQLQLVVTYKGADPLDQALAGQLASNPSFAALDARTEGNQIFFCMGPCADVEKQP
jgi:hypothetical protein